MTLGSWAVPLRYLDAKAGEYVERIPRSDYLPDNPLLL